MNYPVISTAADIAAITTSYGGLDKAFRVRPGPITFQLTGLAGPTSLQIALQFASQSGNTDPNPTVDADWCSLVDAAGAVLASPTTTAVSFVTANGNAICDLSIRLASAGSVSWSGGVPNNISWLRVRVKRTGAAVTAASLRLLCDGDASYTVGA